MHQTPSTTWQPTSMARQPPCDCPAESLLAVSTWSLQRHNSFFVQSVIICFVVRVSVLRCEEFTRAKEFIYTYCMIGFIFPPDCE